LTTERNGGVNLKNA